MVTRERGGSFNLGTTVANATAADDGAPKPAADVRSVLRAFVHPAAIDNGPGEPGQLVRVRLRNFGLTVHDEEFGLTWTATGSELDLARRPSGEVAGSARVPFVLGDQSAEAAFNVNLPRYTNGQIEATLSTIQPEMIREIAKAIPVLAAVDAPLSLQATIALDTSLTPVTGRANIQVGAGRFDLAAGHVPVHDGTVTLSATPERLSIESARFNVPSARTGSMTDLAFHGSVQREAGALDRFGCRGTGPARPRGPGSDLAGRNRRRRAPMGHTECHLPERYHMQRYRSLRSRGPICATSS